MKDELFIEYPYLELCIEFAEKYNTLPDGDYYSDDSEYLIEKRLLIEELTDKRIDTPTRIHKSTGEVQINNDLNYSKSGLLFFLIWCFIKGYGNNVIEDKEADIKALELCNKIKIFNVNNLKEDYLSLIGELKPDLKERYEKLFKI